MRKILLPALILVVFAAGLGLGWFISRPGDSEPRSGPKDSSSNPQVNLVKVQYKGTDAELVANLPKWEELKYPGSKEGMAVGRDGWNDIWGAAGLGQSGPDFSFKVTQPMAATLQTTDAFDQVWKFYETKGGVVGSGGGSNFSTGIPMVFTAKDFSDKGSSFSSGIQVPLDASLQMKGFTHTTLAYTLTVVVSRAKEDKHTCIMLFYQPNTTFLSLLKLHR